MGHRRYLLPDAHWNVHIQCGGEDIISNGPPAALPKSQGGHLDVAPRHQDQPLLLRVPVQDYAVGSDAATRLVRNDAAPILHE